MADKKPEKKSEVEEVLELVEGVITQGRGALNNALSSGTSPSIIKGVMDLMEEATSKPAARKAPAVRNRGNVVSTLGVRG
jgi:uncharacterized protein (DUF362 family)